MSQNAAALLERESAPCCSICWSICQSMPPMSSAPRSDRNCIGPYAVPAFHFTSRHPWWELTLILHEPRPGSRIVKVFMELSGVDPRAGGQDITRQGIAQLLEPQEWTECQLAWILGSTRDFHGYRRDSVEPCLRVGMFPVFEREGGGISVSGLPVAHIVEFWAKRD